MKGFEEFYSSFKAHNKNRWQNATAWLVHIKVSIKKFFHHHKARETSSQTGSLNQKKMWIRKKNSNLFHENDIAQKMSLHIHIANNF